MSKRFVEKVAIVTGSSKGIGASIAKYLADEGASVVVNYSSSKKDGEAVAEAIKKKGGKAIAIKADMRDPKEILNLFAEAKKAFGRLDILVNNAGVYEFAPLEAMTPEHFHKMFDINVLGLLLASKEALNYFGEQGGSIINISSVASTLRSQPNLSVYGATKAAVDQITRILSFELAPRRIRVNAVNPGMVETEGTRSGGFLEGDFRKMVESSIPLGRIGQTDDISPTVAFLASDEARWITGETVAVSGGFH
jgi:3-oxoacyl-[acyl-carrier protein] reductase